MTFFLSFREDNGNIINITVFMYLIYRGFKDCISSICGAKIQSKVPYFFGPATLR